MITIFKTFEWDMGHRVTNHASQCKNLHGHRYKLIVEVGGPLKTEKGSSDQGMVLDFGDLKKLVVEQLINKFDHSFMYWDQDKVMRPFAEAQPKLKMYAVPFVPTVECIVQDFARTLQSLFIAELPDVKLVSLRLFETPTSQALWSEDHA